MLQTISFLSFSISDTFRFTSFLCHLLIVSFPQFLQEKTTKKKETTSLALSSSRKAKVQNRMWNKWFEFMMVGIWHLVHGIQNPSHYRLSLIQRSTDLMPIPNTKQHHLNSTILWTNVAHWNQSQFRSWRLDHARKRA